ncbi:MAG: hypothetical protein ABSD59_02340 [Terracidiphilus sp.]|jgi:hypothetical protein
MSTLLHFFIDLNLADRMGNLLVKAISVLLVCALIGLPEKENGDYDWRPVKYVRIVVFLPFVLFHLLFRCRCRGECQCEGSRPWEW